jgi:hypothetical protein
MENKVFIGLFVAIGIAVGYLFLNNGGKDAEWQKKIDRHREVEDSLWREVKRIDKKLYSKDSLLVQYISILNKSLVELDRESHKNRVLIDSNEVKQANMLSEFCDQLPEGNKPEFCK